MIDEEITAFEKDFIFAAKKEFVVENELAPAIQYAKWGAKYAKDWHDNKGIGHLTEFMKSTKYKRTEKLEGVIRFCAGLISTMDEHKHKHPEEVLEWIYTNTGS